MESNNNVAKGHLSFNYTKCLCFILINYHILGHGIDIFTIFLNINHGRQPLNYFKISKWKGIGVINKDLEIETVLCVLIWNETIYDTICNLLNIIADQIFLSVAIT
jgi:hypothetical protein